MLVEILHSTSYSYTQPVFLEPHVVRLRPRADSTRTLAEFKLTIEPQPVGLTENLDLEGNLVAQAWFEGTTELLTVKAVSKVESSPRNAFDFLLADPANAKLPLRYAQAAEALVAPYLLRARPSAAIDAWSDSIARSVDGQTLAFLTELCRVIRERSLYTIRESGDAAPAEETLHLKRGSCRDLAMFFVDACRAKGIAARFVSGYHESGFGGENRYMHAWAEVYLPGGGWRGFDPTLGLAVAEAHIPVAAAADPKDATPVMGSFRGAAAEAKLRAHIEISSSR